MSGPWQMARNCEGMVALDRSQPRVERGWGGGPSVGGRGRQRGITARSETGLKETFACIEHVGGTGLVLPVDLGDPDGGRASLAEPAFGSIDINNPPNGRTS